MKVLLSIKPEYVEKIFAGNKRFEFRKAIFKNEEVKKVVIYATLPVGRVVGEFEVDGYIAGEPIDVWKLTQGSAGISEEFFHEYFLGRQKAFAIKIGKVRKYKRPKHLHEIEDGCVAPQSYRYLA